MAKKGNFPELESHAKPKKQRTKLRCLAACREELKGVRNSTFGRESLQQSAALVWTTDLPLMLKYLIYSSGSTFNFETSPFQLLSCQTVTLSLFKSCCGDVTAHMGTYDAAESSRAKSLK